MTQECGWPGCKKEKFINDIDGLESSESAFCSLSELDENSNIGTDKNVYRKLWDDIIELEDDRKKHNRQIKNAKSQREDLQSVGAASQEQDVDVVALESVGAASRGRDVDVLALKLDLYSYTAMEELKAERFQATEYKMVMKDPMAVTGGKITFTSRKQKGNFATDWRNVRAMVVEFIRDGNTSDSLEFQEPELRTLIEKISQNHGTFVSTRFHHRCVEVILGLAAKEWWSKKRKEYEARHPDQNFPDKSILEVMHRQWRWLRDIAYEAIEEKTKDSEAKNAFILLKQEVQQLEGFLLKDLNVEDSMIEDKRQINGFRNEKCQEDWISRKDLLIGVMQNKLRDLWFDKRIQFEYDSNQQPALSTRSADDKSELEVVWEGEKKELEEIKSKTIAAKNHVILSLCNTQGDPDFLVPLDKESQEKLNAQLSQRGSSVIQTPQARRREANFRLEFQAQRTWELLEELDASGDTSLFKKAMLGYGLLRSKCGKSNNSELDASKLEGANQFMKGNQRLWNRFDDIIPKLRETGLEWSKKTKEEEANVALKVITLLAKTNPDELLTILSNAGVSHRQFLETFEKRLEARKDHVSAIAAEDGVRDGE